MNERIRELAKQAGYQEDMFGIGHWDMPECKKFAELIVAECTAALFDESERLSGLYSEEDNWNSAEECEYTHLISEKIKEHFGVE